MNNPDQDEQLRIRDITIRYTVGQDYYRLVIPTTTTINTIFLDREEAEAVKAAMGDDWGSETVEISPRGSDWAAVDKRERGIIARNVASLEHIGRLAWSPHHCKTNLCVHEEGCMMVCMKTE